MSIKQPDTSEIDLLINKYHQKNISFFDDNFVVNKERTKQLCNLIYDNNYHKKAEFECQTRGDAIDRDILEHLKKANFTNIAFGIETGSERIMKVINKGETVQQNIDAVKLAKEYGFRVIASFIMGLPTETRAERKMTYKLANDLNLDYAKFNNATPYPGTELYDIAVKDGGFNPGKDWENLSACGTFVEGPFKQVPMSYVPPTISEQELRKDILRANILFWVSPRQIFSIITRGSVAGGWFALPPRWYFNPKEWYFLLKLGFRVILLFLKIVF